MERTGFRVIEWAGLSIAVDSSEDLVWDWSDRGLEDAPVLALKWIFMWVFPVVRSFLRIGTRSPTRLMEAVLMSTSWTGNGGSRFMPKEDVLKDWPVSTAG